ncbi:MAG: sigma 54-interacting transcriptional regulator [Tissierellia bacterium]|nr:sigma 54-interacting transcriptional regulator [Tissierellia bacterium]
MNMELLDFILPLDTNEKKDSNLFPFIEVNEGAKLPDVLLKLFEEDIEEVYIKYKDKIVGKINKISALKSYIFTEKKREAVIMQIFDEIQEGICVCDQNGTTWIWNKAIEKIYDIKKDEILGKNLQEYFTDAADIRVIKTGERVKDYRHSPRPGTEIVISASPIYYDDEIIGAVSTDRSIDEVLSVSRRLKEAVKTIEILETKLGGKTLSDPDFMIGQDKGIKEQVNLALQVAKTDMPILIEGKTGTGKEVFSKFIHNNSNRKGNFVSVNCSAIPESLFESEFFGYVKGAFTGANVEGRQGYFEQANGGTLFLDEVSELPPLQQTKLLRAIQERKIRPLGAEEDIDVNIRLISATNANLEEAVSEKRFRVDLYYRLKGIIVELPDLSNRKEDIEDMIHYFTDDLCRVYNKKIVSITEEAMNILKDYKWPGNIRELKNAMRQMVVMATGDVLEKELIPKNIRESTGDAASIATLKQNNISLTESVENFEKQLIKGTLQETSWNITKTAEILKIPRTTLNYKIKNYKLIEEK